MESGPTVTAGGHHRSRISNEVTPPTMTATLESTPSRFSPLRRRSRFDREGGIDDESLPVAAGMADDVDRLAAFGPAVLAVRWGTTTVSIALAMPAFVDQAWSVVIWCGILVGYAVARTVHPLRYTGDTRSLLRALGELALPVFAVVSTGYWDSPFVFVLFPAVIIAGFARGFSFGIRVALVQIVAIGIPSLATGALAWDEWRTIAQWVVVLLLLALVAGYGRRISGEADRQHSVAMARLGRLADANDLLHSLHQVAQSLPASFDIEDVLENTENRLLDLFDLTALGILTLDDVESDRWHVRRRRGGRTPDEFTTAELPPPLRQALVRGEAISAPALLSGSGPALVTRMGSGLYTPLVARGGTIGLVAVEHPDQHHFTQRDLDLLGGFAEPAALAIDNSRWFGRLRTVGADEERTRIARDLHDRIGQSLAYMAFELDRIVAEDERGASVTPSLAQLRADIRGVIGEVRDTLYDLRTDVSDDDTIEDVLAQFTQRVSTRSEIDIELRVDARDRLPLLQEREMWRIAQEAVANVERHSGAKRARVLWRCRAGNAALEVSDDGKGFRDGTIGRLDSYGIIGMRERASSIGATVEIASAPGRGTRVRCLLTQE